MKGMRTAARTLKNMVPGTSAKRNKESLDTVERRVFHSNARGNRFGGSLEPKRFFQLLGVLPLKPATLKLVEIVKSPSFNTPDRLNALEILERRNSIKAQRLYLQIIPVNDMPVTLRSHMIKFLGAGIGTREQGIVFRKPLKQLMMDRYQQPAIRRVCIKTLASKTRPPKKFFQKIVEEKGADASVKATALDALAALKKKKKR